MIYRSNLQAPDLQPQFAATTICKPRHWSMGHDVLSDAEYEPECGFMTHDEAAILYKVASALPPGDWLDIGCRTGWTTRHIAAAHSFRKKGFFLSGEARRKEALKSNYVHWMDPLLSEDEFAKRFSDNGGEVDKHPGEPLPCTSNDFFADRNSRAFHLKPYFYHPRKGYVGVCIDGNHESPFPLNDARNALVYLADTGVIILHDFWGRPIREGVEYLMEAGMKCRIYNTPAGMAVCWRGDFTPPDHVPDPKIDWEAVRVEKAPEFNFGVCS